jgi:uncharacterized protein (TIGR01777 family)
MKVLVSGSSGFIGSALVSYLIQRGSDVVRLVRRTPTECEIQWDPESDLIDSASISKVDAVVHLAAESIVAAPWSVEQKARIRNSRVKGTRLLANTLSRMERPPTILACASSDVYYGDRGDEVLSEFSGPGKTFLAGVSVENESQTLGAKDAGIRVVNMRFGMVIGPTVAGMAGRFKKGLGGILGDGSHYISWVTLDDAVRAVDHILKNDTLQGAVNIVAPNPVTNFEFTKTLGRILRRPTFLKRPPFLVKLLMGEMAEVELISVRMDSSRLMSTGFQFDYPELEGALRSVLGK